jgi:D-beta-D-heptose 7-phosphate kinase/D-beta-D-heptose 1-phosphate adenosyltransferase
VKTKEYSHNVFQDQAILLKTIQSAQRDHQKIVFTNGCFDILHSGHIRYLQDAANKGDRLIVGVNSDESVKILKGPTRPIIPLAERMEMLAALRCVDWVIPFYEETPENIIAFLKPDILVKGGDYTIPQIVGSTFVLNNGGEVISLPFWDGFSTSDIIARIKKLKK